MIGESPPVAAALVQLRAAGERVTPARRAVLEVLAESREHLDAETVVARVDARAPGVHRATVYRSLQALVTHDVVAHTHVPGGPTIYHLASAVWGGPTGAVHQHGHLQCTVCLRFFDMPTAWLDEVRRNALDALDFELDPSHAALLGRCSRCRNSATDEGHHTAVH